MFISLEGGINEIYSSDEFIMKISAKVLTKRDPPAVTLYLNLPTFGFEKIEHFNDSIVSYGKNYQEQDPGWVKLKGMGGMLVEKNILSKEDTEEYIKKYIEVCETNKIIGISVIMITVSIKTALI